MTRCPTELELEAYLLGAAGARLAPHVEGCARCRDQLEEMRRQGEEFRREVYPRTVDTVVARAGRRGAPRWLLVAVPLAAAAAVLLYVRTAPPPDYLGVKGGSLSLALTVFVHDGEAARAVADGQPVPAGAALRFEVRPAAACRLWIVSVDGAGQVSRLFPPSGEAASVAGAGALPGGAVLDGRAGPERIYAVCTPGSLSLPAVERAARAAAAGGDRGVRAAGALDGLPREATQATVLLEKRP